MFYLYDVSEFSLFYFTKEKRMQFWSLKKEELQSWIIIMRQLRLKYRGHFLFVAQTLS